MTTTTKSSEQLTEEYRAELREGIYNILRKFDACEDADKTLAVFSGDDHLEVYYHATINLHWKVMVHTAIINVKLAFELFGNTKVNAA